MKVLRLVFIALASVSCSSIGRDLVENNVRVEKKYVSNIISIYDSFTKSKESKSNLEAIKKYDVAVHFEKYFLEEINSEKHQSLITAANNFYIEEFSQEHRTIHLYRNCEFSTKEVKRFKERYPRGNSRRDFVEEQVALYVDNVSKKQFLGQALWKYISYNTKDANIFYNLRVQSIYRLRMCNAKGVNLVELKLIRDLMLSEPYTVFMKKFYEVQNIVTSRILKDIESL